MPVSCRDTNFCGGLCTRIYAPGPTSHAAAAASSSSSDIYSYTILEQHGAGVVLQRLNVTSRVSAAAVEILCEMLVVDRRLRPCSAELLTQHRFFTAPL